ncbi:fumarylacetoacetate hydrolase family protein [Methylobacterium nigriterrae]|uniref:fumarylacetoacetate hydrolase family protein n=1 Tax=Methylobacterium nigriterrae TaxID=3127512 RepID=UPI003013EDDC
MTRWIRYRYDGREGFGRLDGETILVHEGDLFGAPVPTGRSLPLAEVRVDLPCRPSKLIALWNNFRSMAEKQNLAHPQAPLFFVKPPNSYAAHGETVAMPEAAGRVLYEGELGIVIGRRGRDLTPAAAADHIFGYTCLNDVTSLDILRADESFPQWTRSKGLDGFSPFGPVIATDLDPDAARVVVRLDGQERQNYPLSDMIYSPREVVAMISQGLTLEPGDVIACGTSNGAGTIKRGMRVEVEIAGIGVLENRFA